MRRRTAAGLCSLVVAVTLMATASPASAAPLQNFQLTSTTAGDIAAAQGAVANGVGTFTETGLNSETILIAGENPIFMTQHPAFQAVSVDPRTCRATVVERGAFEFSQQDGEITYGGSGTYTLAGTVIGQRTGTGCVFSSTSPEQSTLTAKSTEIHAVA